MRPGRGRGLLILGLVGWLLAVSVARAADRPAPDAGTRRMIERLARLTEEAGPWENPFAHDQRVEAMRERLREVRDGRVYLEGQFRVASELMNAGRNAEAAALLGGLIEAVRQRGGRLVQRDRAEIQLQEAVAWLRLGEEENCRGNHTGESCLLPIQGGGVHRSRLGSERARTLLSEYLEREPRDLAARWLLNLAVMTLGDYPNGVPEAQRIPPSVFQSAQPFPRFPNLADAVGLVVDDMAGGTVVEDFDNDGRLDVLFSSWHWQGRLRYFRNEGSRGFVERTEAAGLVGIVGGLNMVQADYDNDGWIDVLVLRGAWLGRQGRHPNSLLRNNGDGTFSDVTEQAGLLSFHPTQTAAWLDFDGDGWLDLFIGNETSAGAVIGQASGDGPPGGAPSLERHPCELYRNRGDGTFVECAAQAGVALEAMVKGVAAGDINNDGRPDLYVSCLGQPNRLFRNDGPALGGAGAGTRGGAWRFTEVGAAAGVTEPVFSFPTWMFDYDNDGWLDLFATGYTTNFSIRTTRAIVADFLGSPGGVEHPRLFRNRGDGTFADATRAAGLERVLYGMGANFGDLDADGWLDMYIGTGDPNLANLVPNVMLRNDAGKTFRDVTTAGGFGHLQKGHGIGFGDLNNDGFQEVVANMGGAYPGDHYHKAVFANPGHAARWLILRLEGVTANRSAIGARVRVVVATPGGERTLHRTVGSGGSFGASALRQEVGLGDALQVLRVEVDWPSPAGKQVFAGVQPGRAYLLPEGQVGPTELRLESWTFPAPGASTPHVHSHAH